MNILVIGSSNTDMTALVPSIPGPGETVVGSGYRVTLGGKGANQAVACARQGARVTFITALGNDSLAQDHLASFKKEGIDTSFIARKPVHTGVALIFVDQNGENSIGVAAGANDMLSPSDIDAADGCFREGDILLLQLEIPSETVLYAARKAKERKMKVILNPAPVRNIPRELFSCTDIITPNRHELAALGIAPEKLFEMGTEYLITTLGAEGVKLVSSGESYIVPAYKVRPVDTVGAGDCFNGAFAASLAMGYDIRASLERAVAAAAIAVTKEGAQAAMPTARETELFIQNNSI
ncbi:MAG: ribokinase [Abditibacteriota bacterium]|nr:ribokinase [Abditibacteriota bacterium]